MLRPVQVHQQAAMPRAPRVPPGSLPALPRLPSPARIARRAVLILLTCWAGQAFTAAAPDQEFDFDLPAGPLGPTLLRIAEVSGTLVSFLPALVDQRSAPAIRGRFTLRQALALAAEPSGLVAEITPGGVATVQPEAPAAMAAASAPAPGPAGAASAVAGAAASAPAAALPRVEVRGSARRLADGLRPLRSDSATRTDTPLAELSQAVSVLTAEALALQGGSNPLEATPYVAGAAVGLVTAGGVENFGLTGVTAPSITVRGLPAPFALSGLRSIGGALPPDTLFIERIEVPKGPSGVLDAIADFKGRGGMVNLVLKEAQPQQQAQFTQAAGTQDGGTLRVAGDVGNAWGRDAAWRVLGFASQSGRTDGGYEHNAAAGLLGSARMRRDRLEASITLQAQRHRVTPLPDAQGGRTLVDGVAVDLPARREPGPPADPADRLLASSAFARMNSRWTLSPRWSLSLNTLAEAVQTDGVRHQPFTPTEMRRAQGLNAGAQLGLVGVVDHDVLRHRVLLGLDAGGWRTRTGGVDLVDGLGLLDVDIRERKMAVLLQDEISAGPLRLRAGLQHARTPQRDEVRRRSASGELQSLRNYLPVSANNWDAGLLYQLRPGLAAYVGAQETTEANLVLPGDEFSQDSPQLPDGVPIPPSTTRQVQAGLRVQAGPRLSLTAEAFRLRQSNLKLLNTFSFVIPGRVSDGLELELSGRVRPDVELSLGFTYLRCTETVDGDPARPTECAQVARRSLYLLSRVRLGDRLAPFTHVGLAFQAASGTRIGVPYFAPAALGLPGGGRLDLQLNGEWGPWSLTASLRNVFDQRLFGAAADPRYIPLLPGRSLGLAATYTP
jgi:iron complex outermembrane receptor protein